MSNATAAKCRIASEFSETHSKFAASAYIVVILMSLCGNGTVLVVMYKNHSMRSVTNLLICNSAVADLLITILPTVWEVLVLLKYRTWPLGTFMCTFMYMSVYLSVAATVITLMIITADRYNAVIYPYKKYLTTKMLLIVIPAIWIISFLFASPTTFTQKVIYVNGHGLECIEQWPNPFSSTESPKHYTVILFISLYALPLILMSILYAIMARKLAHRVVTNHILRQRRTVIKDNHNHLLLPAVMNSNKKSKCKVTEGDTRPKLVSSTIRKRRVIKMLISIVIVFAMSWFPVYCIQFLIHFNPYYTRCPLSIPDYVYFLAFFMQYANSAINPILYFGFSMSYRKGFVNAFSCFVGKSQK